jgi:succinyl-CoA synthetase beta subunit
MLLNDRARQIIASSRERGWVLEPDAKQILSDAGLSVPVFRWVHTLEEAQQAAKVIGYPLVAKIVSPKALHKSDVGGVVVGVDSNERLGEVFEGFRDFEGFEGVHLEAMASGVELIAGAKTDSQFGPVILLGIGGTSVEIYQDTAIRMAPLKVTDIESMVHSLKARRLLEGYRGAAPVNMERLTQTLMAFSKLVMEMAEQIESIDLNPVMCSDTDCVVADARIMLS